MDFNKLRFLIRKFRYEIVALIFTAYGMYLRFVCLANREFWVDELIPLQIMQGPFKPFWQRCFTTDLTYFPGEYIINSPFVALFGTNKWGISIPHSLFTLLGFYFLYLICKRYFHSVFSWIATFSLVAVHQELIFHSFEFRPYAVLPTLALAAFYFSEQIVSSRYHLSLAQKILIGFSFIFIIIYHIYGAVILFFTIVYFLLRESGKQSFREVFKHNYPFLSVITIIGLFLFLWYSIGSPSTISGVFYNVFEYIPNPVVNLFGFIKVNLCNLVGRKILYPLAIFLLSPFFLPYRLRLQQIGFLLVLVILPITVIFYSNILVGYWILQRQFVWVMPLFAFLIGWCLDSFIGYSFVKMRRQR